MDSARAHLRLVTAPSEPLEEAVDTSDLAVIFRRFAPYVARIGIRILGCSHEVDDLVQDVFLDAHRGLRHLREPAAIRGWLATVTVRRARRRLRHRKLWAVFGLENTIDPARLAHHDASPEEHAHLGAVYRVLDGISADARIAWILRCVEGESLERVAEIAGCSRATAHRRVTEAQHALEKAFSDG